MRLDRLAADAAGISRGEARKIIKDGRVSVGGKTVTDISAHFDAGEALSIDGKRVLRAEFIYIMMNKPAGVLCASKDSRQKTVLDLLPGKYRRARLFPVGRLDKDTEGLLLLTNDGARAHRLLSPRRKVPKTYFARLDGDLSECGAQKLENGVDIGGYITLPATLEKISGGEWHITIVEGKFHQVKRMFQSQGREVVFLKRIAFGSLTLDRGLKSGEFRHLLSGEVQNL